MSVTISTSAFNAKVPGAASQIPSETLPSLQRGWMAWVLLAAILIGTMIIRVRMLDFPLERDEGEYAYIGRLILDGVPPYKLSGNHKFPGTYFAYAVSMAIFGSTIQGVHLGLLVVNAASIVLLFLLARRMFGDAAAVGSAAAYALLSASPTVLGFAAHMTHFVVLPVLGGLLLLWRAIDDGRRLTLLLAASCLGISIVIRQTSLVFVGFAGVFWLIAVWEKLDRLAFIRHIFVFGAGVAAPVLLLFLSLAVTGVFPNFWQWTVTQAMAYGSEFGFGLGVLLFLQNTVHVIGPQWGLWIGASVGLRLLFSDRSLRSLFLVGFFIAGLISISPGFFFRAHYYVQWLPALSLLFGRALAEFWDNHGPEKQKLSFRLGVCFLVLLVFIYPVVAQANFFFKLAPNDAIRLAYGLNPFPESPEIARYVRENSTSDENLAILGSEPQIFFYAQRRSATSLIYSYPLMETHRFAKSMQADMIREIEAAAPKFLLYVKTPTSWLVRPDSDHTILVWADAYIAAHYQRDGIIEVVPNGSRYTWGSDALNFCPDPKGNAYVAAVLYRRKPTAHGSKAHF